MKSKRIFWKLFLSYLIFLFIALLVILLIFHTSVQSMQKLLYQQTHSSLQSICNTVDAIKVNVENYATTILNDQDVISFLSLEEINLNSSEIADVYRYTRALNKYKLADSLIQEVYIMAKANDFIIKSGSAVRYTPLYHDILFGFTGMAYDALKPLLQGFRGANGYYVFPADSDAGGELAYVMKMPYSGVSGGSIMIRVNTASIHNLLQTACVGSDSLAFILDKNNQLLALSSGGQSTLSIESLLQDYRAGGIDALQNREYFAAQVSSSEGWQYFSIIPRRTILAELSMAQTRIILTTIALVFFGIILSFLLTHKKARSLGNVVNALSSAVEMNDLKNKNEYGAIEQAVTRLVRERSTSRTLNENQQRLIHRELLHRLFLEDYRHIDELRSLVDASDAQWHERKFGVITLAAPAFGDIADDPVKRSALVQRLSAAIHRISTHLCTTEGKMIVVLFLLEQDCSPDHWQKISEEAANTLINNIGSASAVTCCVSGLHTRLSEIHEAYDETILLSEYAKTRQQEQVILRLNDLPQTDSFYYYPMDLELKLVHLVKTGQTSELESLLQILYSENFERRLLSMAMIRQLVFEMRGTIVRCLQSVAQNRQIDEKMQELSRETTIDGIFSYVVKISRDICQIMNENLQQDKLQMKSAIRETIEREYSNSNFTIHQLADQVQLSEHALYCFIRDNFDLSFWEMVEQVRIQQACAFIRGGLMTICHVAGRVGYNSDHSFRRAFKRVMNMSPSEYMQAERG